MPQLVNTFSDVPLYTARVSLDGVTYIMNWDYNGKEDRLYFDFLLADGTVLLRGIKVVLYYPLLSRTANPNSTPGDLICTAPEVDDTPPGLGELGSDRRCQLWYYTPEELLEFLDEVGELAI